MKGLIACSLIAEIVDFGILTLLFLMQTIETEIIQVEEEIAKGVSDEKIENEAVGILEQILAFKAKLGF